MMKKKVCMVIALVMVLSTFCFPVNIVKAAECDVSVLTFNVCVTSDFFSENSVANRQDRIKTFLDEYQPDIIGFQEINGGWYTKMQSMLPNYSNEYRSRHTSYLVYVEDGTPVFWKTEKFTCLEQGSFWLSETPEVESKSWNSEYYRICSYAVLLEKASGALIIFYNSHIDLNTEAMYKQTELLVSRIEGSISKYKLMGYTNITAFCTADFNFYEWDDDYRLITGAGFSEVRYKADVKLSPTTQRTYNSYSDTASGTIDLIFAKGGIKSYNKYKVVTEWYNNCQFLSDHYPVYGELTLYGSNSTAYCINGNTPVNIGDDVNAYIYNDTNKALLTGGGGTVTAKTPEYVTNQKWRFLRQGDGSYKIANLAGNCLDINSAESSVGTAVQVYEDNGTPAQRFYLYYIGDCYYIKPVYTVGMVVDVLGGDIKCGLNVFNQAYGGEQFKLVMYTNKGSNPLNKGASFKAYIKNINNGNLLTAGTIVSGKAPKFNTKQLWQFERQPDMSYTITSYDGKAMYCENSGISNGTNVITSNNVSDIMSGRFYIYSKNSAIYIKPVSSTGVLDLDQTYNELHLYYNGGSEGNERAQRFELLPFELSKYGFTLSEASSGTVLDETKKTVTVAAGLSNNGLRELFEFGGLLAIEYSAGTGNKIIAGNEIYTIIAKGDADGDGAVSATDLLVVKAHLKGETELSGIWKEAVTQNDDEITSYDYINMKYFLKTK